MVNIVNIGSTKKGLKKFTYKPDASVQVTDAIRDFIADTKSSALRHATEEQKADSD